MHAPMIMRGPGLPAGKRVKGFTQSADVASYRDRLAGASASIPEMQGQSLLPLATGAVDKVRDFAIAGYYRYSAAIYTEDWSFIHWLRPDEKKIGESVNQMYVATSGTESGFARAGIMGLARDGGGALPEVFAASGGDAGQRLREAATPGRRAAVDLHARQRGGGAGHRRALRPPGRPVPAEQHRRPGSKEGLRDVQHAARLHGRAAYDLAPAPGRECPDAPGSGHSHSTTQRPWCHTPRALSSFRRAPSTCLAQRPPV